MRKGLFLFVLALVPHGFGISRVGNSMIGSSKSGFVAAIPYPFVELVSLKAEGLRLKSVLPENQVDPNPGFIQSFIDAKDFDEQYPDLHFPSVELAREWFLNRGWQESKNANQCVLVMTINLHNTFTGMALWGDGRGIVLYGFDRPRVVQGLTKILNDIQLDVGACQW